MSNFQMNSPVLVTSSEGTQLHDYARGMVAIAVMIHDFCLATETAGHDEMYDDPQDPLGRAAALAGPLEHLVDGGRRLAEGVLTGSPPDPTLILSLQEGADRLSREIPRLTSTLDYHRAIKTLRLAATLEDVRPV